MKRMLACLLALALLCAAACPAVAALAMPAAQGDPASSPPDTHGEAMLPPDGIGEAMLPPDGIGEAMLPPDGIGEAMLPPDGIGEAMLPPALGGSPSGPFVITGVFPSRPGNQDYQLLTLSPNEPLSALTDRLRKTLPCDAVDSAGTSFSYECPVVWDLSDETATAAPGRITLHGTMVPKEGDLLAKEFSGKVEQSVLVTGGEPETLEQLSASFLSTKLLALGDAPEPYCDTSDAICFTAIPGEYFECPVVWDYQSVNPNALGRYPITGTLNLPAGFALPPDFKPFTRSISVIDGTKADLSAASFDPDTDCLNCRWIDPIPEDTPVRLEYAVGNGAWTPDDKEAYLHYNKYTGTSLYINFGSSRPHFELNTDYYFRIVYGAEGQQTISNVLHVRLKNWDFLRSDSLAPPFDIGGDRDGGDQGGSELPDLEQPAPESDDEENEEPSPVIETVTETSTTLSGARLDQLTARGGTVLFEKQGVAVELSAAFLDSLRLGDRQLLEVSIQRPTADTFRLALYADGKAVTALPDTVVRLPQNVKGPPLECTNQAGVHVSDVTYELENGTVRCAVSATGTYRIQAALTAPVAVEPPPVDASAAPVAAEASIADSAAPLQGSVAPPIAEPAASAAATTSASPDESSAIKADAEGDPPVAPHQGSWVLVAGILLAGAGWLLHRRRHGG